MSMAHHHQDDQAVHSDRQEILEICNSVARSACSSLHSLLRLFSHLNSHHLTWQSITSLRTMLPVVKAAADPRFRHLPARHSQARSLNPFSVLTDHLSGGERRCRENTQTASAGGGRRITGRQRLLPRWPHLVRPVLLWTDHEVMPDDGTMTDVDKA